MEKLTEELLKKLDLLAQKLGTTIEHLWGVLVQQARIEAIYAVVSLAFEIVLLTAAIQHIAKSLELGKECTDGRTFRSVILGVFAVIFFFVAVAQISNIGYLFNPEFYALEQAKWFLGGH